MPKIKTSATKIMIIHSLPATFRTFSNTGYFESVLKLKVSLLDVTFIQKIILYFSFGTLHNYSQILRIVCNCLMKTDTSLLPIKNAKMKLE